MNGRAYYILVGNDPAGRELGASHALIDAFIRENAGKLDWLDFEDRIFIILPYTIKVSAPLKKNILH